MINILLIAGHGDGDCGAVGYGYQEAELTRDFVKRLRDKLLPYANVDVFDTSKNMYKFLKSGGKFDFKKYTYVLETHFNKSSYGLPTDNNTTGTEILVHESEDKTSVENKILKNICSLGFKNRGIKKVNNLKVMNTCKKQGTSHALLEICFINDHDDLKLYFKNIDSVADAVVKGISEGFALRSKKEAINELTEANDIIWELCQRNIISNTNLWLNYSDKDINIYWLLRKTVHYIRCKEKTGTLCKRAATAFDKTNDNIWELSHRNIITNINMWKNKAFQDQNIYWILRKIVHYFKEYSI